MAPTVDEFFPVGKRMLDNMNGEQEKVEIVWIEYSIVPIAPFTAPPAAPLAAPPTTPLGQHCVDMNILAAMIEP
jgi:hypothetical protein